jgi:DnaJ family protein C protein 22
MPVRDGIAGESSGMRHRRKPNAANGLPDELAGSVPNPDGARTAAPALPTKTVKINTHKGHVGIRCSNAIEPVGVHLDECDPADQASAVGLRAGDIVVACNGVSISDHSALVGAIDTAKKQPPRAESATLTLEYVEASQVAGVVAALRAAKPPQKSLALAYALCLFAGPSGLHHFYLGRDAHGVLHALTLGLLGLGWFRDLICLPRYVQMANEDASILAVLRSHKQSRGTRSPSLGVSRFLSVFIFGWMSGYLAMCLLPPWKEAPYPYVVAYLFDGIIQSAGIALTTYLICSCDPIEGSLKSTFWRAFVVSFAGRCFGYASSFWVCLGAIWGFKRSSTYRQEGLPQRRVRLTVKRRAAIIVGALSFGWGSVGVALYQHGRFAVRTADGGMQSIRFKDAVHHALNSPFVRNMGDVLWRLITEGPTLGWQETWKKAFETMDLAGEGHACERLTLPAGCLEDFSTVKRTYRSLALEFHPDKQAGNSAEVRRVAEERFREVQEAYEHLSKLHNMEKQKKRDEEPEEF